MLKIILASASPRRRELLAQIGISFQVLTAGIEEKAAATEPGGVVEELSCQKAEAVLSMLEDVPEDVLVIGADTVVAAEGEILGKPSDRRAAAEMLRRLSGKTHEVYTGVTLLYRSGRLQDEAAGEETFAGGAGEKPENGGGTEGGIAPEVSSAGRAGAGSRRICRKVFHEVTRVSIYPMTEEEIACYVATGDCMDKAGAYGIQGFFARFVEKIDGDYNNVVGLPAGRLYQEAKEWIGE